MDLDGKGGAAEPAPREPDADELGDPGVAPTIRALGSAGSDTLELDDDGSAVRDRFAPGATYGHFIVREILGEGGMGVVLSARDPDLERTVAIKVVRSPEAPRAARDLLAEAQAMAKLAHPNVVTVFEVGRSGGEVFLVMEHVAGDTLAGWLAARDRGWDEIVRMFIDAGAGLVAAHEVGLVHRDFKPQNVLVDGGGRPRVTDFGIARLASSEVDSIAGTVGYMAPEQRAGEPVDHRADQYAFAVALREALGDDAPPMVRAALERGTSFDPDDRFRSMSALLGALERALEPRRPPLLWGVTIAVTAVATLAVVVGGSSEPSECERGAELIDQVWSAGERQAVTRAFEKTGRNHASVTAARVARLLDDRAAAWKLGRRAACRAVFEVRERRLACLDRQLGAIGAQLAVFREADATAVDRAVRAASALPAADACADVQADAAPGLPAGHPATSAVDELAALRRAGRLEAASARADEVLRKVEASGDQRLLARALLVSGRIASDADRTDEAREQLARAAKVAAAAGDDRVMGEALVRQAAAVISGGRPAEALGVLDAADAIITRTRQAELAIQLKLRRGEALTRTGAGDRGVELLAEAVAEAGARAERDPRTRIDLAAALGMLSAAHTKRGEYARSRDAIERGMAIEIELLGPRHPEVAASMHDLAVTEVRTGDYDAGLEHYRLARDIIAEAYGEDHPHIGRIELSIGNLELLRGRLEAAAGHYQQARSMLAGSLGADHPDLAIVETGLAAIYRDSDRCDQANPHYRAAIAIYEKAEIAGLSLATALTGLGVCSMEVGDGAGSRAALERALRELDAGEIDPIYRAEPMAALAQTLWLGGERRRGLALAREVARSLAGVDDPMVAPLRDSVVAWIPEWEAALR